MRNKTNKTSARMSDIYQVCDYVLSQDCEREHLIEELKGIRDCKRSELRTTGEDHIFYIAFKILHGRVDARKELTEILDEVMSN